MSLEAIEKVTEVEQKSKERRLAAEAEARQIVADAERAGLALLQQVRVDAAEEGKTLLRQAEERAAKRAAEIDAYIIHFRYFLFGLNYTVILS